MEVAVRAPESPSKGFLFCFFADIFFYRILLQYAEQDPRESADGHPASSDY